MYRNLILLLIGMLGVAACASTDTNLTTNTFETVDNATILLVEPDVELTFLKAAGVSEVRADWTDTGKENVLAEIARVVGDKGHRMIEYDVDPANERAVQIVKLHEVVGATIIKHRFLDMPLPTKKGQFDWSLGPGMADLAEETGADYALFLFARGEYASAGRQTLAIGLAVLGGGSVSNGGQAAWASLVDMATGDVVWFNVAYTGPGTDMREPEGAEYLVGAILKDIPL